MVKLANEKRWLGKQNKSSNPDTTIMQMMINTQDYCILNVFQVRRQKIPYLCLQSHMYKNEISAIPAVKV